MINKAKCTWAVLFVLWSINGVAQVRREWARVYPGGPLSGPTAVALNYSSGNIYVTGGSGIIAYDPAGNELWRDHGGLTIAVDSTNWNVYTSGTRAYDCHGNLLWSALDFGVAIAVNANTGNVYSTGVFFGTVAYDSAGNQMWAGARGGTAIAVDSATGNIYATGTIDNHYATVAFDSGGHQLWDNRYIGPANGPDIVSAIAADSTTGNVYVTGKSNGGPGSFDFEYATAAYDSAGNQLWVARYNGGGSFATAIAVDGVTGNVYVTGGVDSFPNDGYGTIAYDSSGNQLWVARYSLPNHNNRGGQANAIALDNNGNIYVTGVSSLRSPGDYFWATVAYDPPGNQLWVAGDFGFSQRYAPVAIAVDGGGNVYVTGAAHPFFGNQTVKYSQP